MNWNVTYRGKDGRQETIQIEAPDRSGVFAELSKRGISAIRVEEAKGKLKPRKAAASGGSSGLFKGIVAGAIVVVAAIAAWMILSPNPEEQKEAKEKKSGKIAEVTPAPASQPDVEEPVVEEPKPIDPNARPTKVGETLNGYIKLPSGRLHRVLGVVTNSATASIKGKYEIFDHACENEIAGFMAMEPGQGLVGTPRYNGRFTKDFLESLKHQ